MTIYSQLVVKQQLQVCSFNHLYISFCFVDISLCMEVQALLPLQADSRENDFTYKVLRQAL